jgi:hypothetical protein
MPIRRRWSTRPVQPVDSQSTHATAGTRHHRPASTSEAMRSVRLYMRHQHRRVDRDSTQSPALRCSRMHRALPNPGEETVRYLHVGEVDSSWATDLEV